MSKADVLNPALSLYIHAQVAHGRQALVIGDDVWSYDSLATEAGRVASWLRSRPWRRGSDRVPRVGILAARTPETYAAILGTLWAGGTYVPLGHGYPHGELLSIITHRADLDAMVLDPGSVALAEELEPALPPHVLVGPKVEIDLPRARVTPWQSLAELGPADPPAPLGPDHPAYILFTPDMATGEFRGIIVSAASLAHFLMAMRALYQFGPKDRFAQFADVSSDALNYEVFACLDGGGCVHVVPQQMLDMPAVFLKQRNITAWVSDPRVIPEMARKGLLKRGAFPWLRVSIFTGDGLPIESGKAWEVAAPHSIVDNHYGPPEVTAAALLQRLTRPPLETPGRGTLALGEPFPAMAAEIVNDRGEFLSPNTPGELAVSGPQLSLGYLADEALTNKRFPTLFHPRLGYTRWFLTGHPATKDAQGVFHSPGHIDNQVKVLGHRVAMEGPDATLALE
jgi:D-alanine--poly(phosphoribitol) ligase subunit 1